MPRLIKLEPRPEYQLFVEFADGVSGVIDLSRRLFGAMFEPLRDPEVFRAAQIDEFGAPCWPNGADLAPDALYLQLKNRTPNVA